MCQLCVYVLDVVEVFTEGINLSLQAQNYTLVCNLLVQYCYIINLISLCHYRTLTISVTVKMTFLMHNSVRCLGVEGRTG